MSPKGLSRARNLGIEATNGEIIAFLDDDCTVRADWLTHVAAAFMRHQQAALVFGTVISTPHDKQIYYIPSYDAKTECCFQGRLACLRVGGMGASMYLRRDLVRGLGPFDVHLGPGSGFFGNGDDVDYSYRCLASGCRVVKTPLIIVEHHGIRAYNTGAALDLLADYAYTAGAVVMKLLRCREMAALLLLVHGLRYFSLNRPHSFVPNRHPTPVRLIAMHLRGLLASFQLSVDRQHYLYVSTRDRDAGPMLISGSRLAYIPDQQSAVDYTLS